MKRLFSYLQEKHGISRREYMQMLKEGAIYVDDHPVSSMQEMSTPGKTLEIRSWKKILLTEKIQELKRKQSMIVLFNKPKGYAVSKEDKHNKTIYELLPASRKKDFYYIGRLDKDSHGLLLLTNDTALVDFYEKPENDIHKIYEVQIDKPIKSNHIQQAKKWIPVDEEGNRIKTAPWKASGVSWELLKVVNIRYERVKDKYYAIVTLNEWKKRHIRRLFKALGYIVKDLKRTKVGIYQLWSIKLGKYMLQKYKA